jgi:hypothetical protein
MKTFIRFAVLLCVLVSSNVFSQVSRDAAVELDVVVDSVKPSITLRWKADPRATSIQVSRRFIGGTSWGSAKTVVKTDSLYRDTTVEVGKTYEYRVRKNLTAGSAITAWGYVISGINIPAQHDKGGIFLVVDTTYAADLKNELKRLENDLFTDGYNVTRINVSRDEKPTDVKEKISSLYLADPSKYTTVFLLGRVPVPYSGFLNPDGHPEHYGAWPADAYYGEFDSEWLDSDYQDTIVIYNTGQKDSLGNWILDTAVVRKANYNITDDGKFDVISFLDDIDLQVGRVDFADMTAFGKSEKELLKQYLDKDHNYRVGLLTAPKRGLIDDNFGYFRGEAFASSGWRNLPTMVGRDSVKEIDWFTTLSVDPYLWAYGTGGGWDQGATGIGNTSDFASQGSKAIFTMLFGSYFGDWNTSNNFLRAPLATEYGLSCAWSGRPYWHFYPMGMGEGLGYCARKTQNNAGDLAYNSSATGVHIALMGDPTLKLYPVMPPAGLLTIGSDVAGNKAMLGWEASQDPNYDGYIVFRRNKETDPYKQIAVIPKSQTFFHDLYPLDSINHYFVHTYRLEVSPSGSYYNLSQGIHGIAGPLKNGVVSQKAFTSDKLIALQTTLSSQITLTLGNTSNIEMSLVDATGKTLAVITDRVLPQGEYHFELPYSDLSSGVYFIRVIGTQKPLSAKILVVK